MSDKVLVPTFATAPPTGYTRTFSNSGVIRGVDNTHKIVRASIVPSDKSSTAYAVLFRTSLEVILEHAEISVTCFRARADQQAPFASCAILGDVQSVTTVHELGIHTSVASSGATASQNLDRTLGLRRVLKGVADVGDLPVFCVGVSSSYDASNEDVAFFRWSWRVRFVGESNAASFEQSIPADHFTVEIKA
jgi:hypothetical protein